MSWGVIVKWKMKEIVMKFDLKKKILVFLMCIMIGTMGCKITSAQYSKCSTNDTITLNVKDYRMLMKSAASAEYNTNGFKLNVDSQTQVSKEQLGAALELIKLMK